MIFQYALLSGGLVIPPLEKWVHVEDFRALTNIDYSDNISSKAERFRKGLDYTVLNRVISDEEALEGAKMLKGIL